MLRGGLIFSSHCPRFCLLCLGLTTLLIRKTCPLPYYCPLETLITNYGIQCEDYMKSR